MKQIALALALALMTFPLTAGRPSIANAQLTNVSAAGDLAAQIRSAPTPWVAYAVPALNGDTISCCYDSGRSCTSYLDDGANFSTYTSRDGDDGPALAAGELYVFYRHDGSDIERVRIFSSNCPLDARSSAVTWIEGVNPRQSVAFLASLADDDERKVARSAVDAMALHGDESATDQLEAMLRSNRSTEARGHAAFWLGHSRGARGYVSVKRVANDPNEPSKLREKAVFAMSQSEEPSHVDDLIALAHRDASSKVRQQSLFWLSQVAGKKAAGALRSAADNDPDDDVKKKAVFGISQLPNDQSIPLLVDLMRTNKSSAVRKQAAFWLGQKDDPRALQAIEDLLRR
jgi:HEAT repeat protein